MENKIAGLPEQEIDDNTFKNILGHFLFSPVGARYQSKFKFYGVPRCGKPAPPVSVRKIN
jgi:hypothetical protein